jgi:hypothetical protein
MATAAKEDVSVRGRHWRNVMAYEYDPPLTSDLELSLGQLRFKIALNLALDAYPSDPGSWPATNGFDAMVTRLSMRSPLEIWLVMSGSMSLGAGSDGKLLV